jgi:hypothetical protein
MMRLQMLTILLFATSLAHGQPDAPMGSICGTVQNENGASASLVRIVAIYQGSHTGLHPSGKTDSTGHYCIDNLDLGNYVMSADDPEKGYPEMGSIFYSWKRPNPEVHIAIENLKGMLIGGSRTKRDSSKWCLRTLGQESQSFRCFSALHSNQIRKTALCVEVAYRPQLFSFHRTKTSISP